MHSRGPFPAYLNALFGDPEIAAALSPQAQLTAMIEVEAALAAAQADLGVIPLEASKAIIALTRECPLSPSDLSQATGRDGVPVPGLVAALRSVLGAEHAPHLHRGATSQDILDTATCLTLGAALDILEKRLKRAMAALADLAEAHRRTVMVARTRGQQATPTTFGLKAAGWLLPLLRLAERLHHLRKDALPLSFGGASGTLAAYGPKAREIERRMAERLGLAMAIMPWHAQRDGLIEVGCWLTALTAALGKIATDVALLAQSEVNEVRLADAGGSSTMPNKANPTRAETLAALARYATGLMTALQQAALSAQERDGAAWQLEWLSLPPLVEAAGCALAQGQWMLASLVVDEARMRANFEAARGLPLAEAVSFALAEHMPLPDAQALVKEACRSSLKDGRHLIDVLSSCTDAPLDWSGLRDPSAQTGQSDPIIDRVLAAYLSRTANASNQD